ncbi:hypothetical protein FHN55_14785 [Streptomyces sp. NP160]|uniref:hypothetical protein n=1 Tax=Streptomyces sp. NP160 TaxID=2586637 RepID=UPI001118CF87|nr:hypothetical protein [Streptomyces sp. NP160]TNM64095.1 hypothetical protein FHN55_14785 [Streptomyces sp. NP160]
MDGRRRAPLLVDVTRGPRRWSTRDRYPAWAVSALLAATGAVLLVVSEPGSLGTAAGWPLLVVSTVLAVGRLVPWHASTQVDSLGVDVRRGPGRGRGERISWAEVRRVLPATGWSAGSRLLLRDGRCVPLAGVDRRGARHLARRLERAQRTQHG